MKLKYLIGLTLLVGSTFSANATLSRVCRNGQNEVFENNKGLQGAFSTPSNDIILARWANERTLEVSGQHATSYWHGKCVQDIENPSTANCEGTGAVFGDQAFTYTSKLIVSCEALTEKWQIFHIDGKSVGSGSRVLRMINKDQGYMSR